MKKHSIKRFIYIGLFVLGMTNGVSLYGNDDDLPVGPCLGHLFDGTPFYKNR